MGKYWYKPSDISLDDFDFNSQKDTVKIGKHLKNIVVLHKVPVGSMPCSSAMTSQNLAPIWFPHWPRKREKCVGASAYHNMSATGLRMLEVCQRKKAHECIRQKIMNQKSDKTSMLQAYNPMSGIWPPWTCTSSRMAARVREVESERRRL